MAAAHKQLVHGLVDRSHERVVQARAGQRLQRILSEDEHAAVDHHASLPLLPSRVTTNAVAPALVYNARANERRIRKLENGSSNSSEPSVKPRRQGVLAVSVSVDSLERRDGHQQHHTSSQEQFLAYVHQKSYRSGGLRPNDRRQGVLPKAKELRKLVAAATAEQDEVHESAKAKLARALAKLRGHGAFLQARELKPPPTPSFGDIKNPHLAFLEFRRQGAEVVASHHRVHPSAGLEDGNTTAKIPIRFGDQICLLSTSSHLPLSIGMDGRSRTAESTAVGPHMTFTVVDFCHPSRRDELTVNDAFWLRVDASALQDGADTGHHDGEGDDLESLLVDTSYYLGCPGWLDTECTAHAAQSKRRRRGRTGEERPKLFRLVAMKALTPSRDYYGDDEATREFTMETNENIVRLARWRFVFLQLQAQPSTGDVNDALLNCSVVQLTQDHNFVLSYDASQLRGVCRPGSRRSREREPRPPTRPDDGMIRPPQSKPVPPDSMWQVRLLRRQASPSRSPRHSVIPDASEVEAGDDDPAVKWLREKQALVARNGEKIAGKMGLAQLARDQFERVAAESNNKLAQIEKHKAQRAPEYFGQLLQAVSASPHGSSPTKKPSSDERREPTRLPMLHRQ